MGYGRVHKVVGPEKVFLIGKYLSRPMINQLRIAAMDDGFVDDSVRYPILFTKGNRQTHHCIEHG